MDTFVRIISMKYKYLGEKGEREERGKRDRKEARVR